MDQLKLYNATCSFTSLDNQVNGVAAVILKRSLIKIRLTKNLTTRSKMKKKKNRTKIPKDLQQRKQNLMPRSPRKEIRKKVSLIKAINLNLRRNDIQLELIIKS